MRLAKIAVAIILLFLAALATIGEFRLIINRPALTWYQHANAILFIGLCVCAGCLLLRRPVDPVAEVYCSRCRALGGHTVAPAYSRSVNPLAWHFGGFLLSIFYAGGRQQRFRCRECGELFYSHTTISRGYRLLFLLFVALIAVRILREISEFMEASR